MMREDFFREVAMQLDEPIEGVQEAAKKLRQVILEEAPEGENFTGSEKNLRELKARLKELEAILRQLASLRLSAKKAADLAVKGEEEALALANALELA